MLINFISTENNTVQIFSDVVPPKGSIVDLFGNLYYVQSILYKIEKHQDPHDASNFIRYSANVFLFPTEEKI